MAPATTLFVRWYNLREFKMNKFKLSAWTIIFLLYLQRCYGNGEPNIDNKTTEDSPLNFLFNCSIHNLSDELKNYINESSIVCSSPGEHAVVILCDDFLKISKEFCESTLNLNLPKFRLSDTSSVCSPPVTVPQQLGSKFENKSGVIFTLTQEDICKANCLNEADTKILSLCVLGRAYLDIYTELFKLKTVATSVKSASTAKSTTTTKSTTSPGAMKKISTISPTTTSKIPTSTAVPSTKKLVQSNFENNYDDQDQAKITLPLQDTDLDLNKEDDGSIDDEDDADKGDMELQKPATNVEESAAAGEGGNIYGRKKGTFGYDYPDDGNSHFFVYFLTVVVLCILGYVLYHNKKKVIALIVEGRQDKRRRPNTNQYRKLDSNLEEVMHGYENGSDANVNGARRSNIIY